MLRVFIRIFVSDKTSRIARGLDDTAGGIGFFQTINVQVFFVRRSPRQVFAVSEWRRVYSLLLLYTDTQARSTCVNWEKGQRLGSKINKIYVLDGLPKGSNVQRTESLFPPSAPVLVCTHTKTDGFIFLTPGGRRKRSITGGYLDRWWLDRSRYLPSDQKHFDRCLVYGRWTTADNTFAVVVQVPKV